MPVRDSGVGGDSFSDTPRRRSGSWCGQKVSKRFLHRDSETQTETKQFQTSETQTISDKAEMAGKLQINLAPYSGHPVGTNLPGGLREEYTVQKWLQRVEKVALGAGWDDEQKAGQAGTALAANSPAEMWYDEWIKLQKGKSFTWKDFKIAIVEQFSPPLTIMNRVGAFRAIKQGATERAKDYGVKVRANIGEYWEDIEQEWAKPKYNPDWAPDDAMKKRINDLIRDASDFQKTHVGTTLYGLGAESKYLTRITDDNLLDMDEMIKRASLMEVSQTAPAQRAKPALAAVGYEESAVIKEMRQEIAALKKQSGSASGQKQESKSKDRPPRDTSRATCYYCFKVGHISTHCEVRKTDRDKGQWRRSTKDRPLTKEQWDALPREQRIGRPAQPPPDMSTAAMSAEELPPTWWSALSEKNC